jgi:hypothetical protein
VSPDFAGCHVPVDRRQRMGVPAWLDGHTKKPAGVTPSASCCDCRLDFRCHRDLRQACIGIVNERLTGQFIPVAAFGRCDPGHCARAAASLPSREVSPASLDVSPASIRCRTEKDLPSRLTRSVTSVTHTMPPCARSLRSPCLSRRRRMQSIAAGSSF